MKEEDSEVGSESTPVVTLYSRHHETSGTISNMSSPQTPVSPGMSCTVEDVLHLLRHLYVILTYRDDVISNLDGKSDVIPAPVLELMRTVHCRV